MVQKPNGLGSPTTVTPRAHFCCCTEGMVSLVTWQSPCTPTRTVMVWILNHDPSLFPVGGLDAPVFHHLHIHLPALCSDPPSLSQSFPISSLYTPLVTCITRIIFATFLEWIGQWADGHTFLCDCSFFFLGCVRVATCLKRG
jgi:hypothetical protein